MYACDRLVMRSLSQRELDEVAAGRLHLDQAARSYFHERLSYRFVVTEGGKEAHDLERTIRETGLEGTKPVFNPQ